MPPVVYSLIAIGLVASVIYWIIPIRIRTVYLSLLSIFVYIIWSRDLSTVFFLLLESALGFCVCYFMKKQKNSKICLIIGIITIILVLAFFKYRKCVFCSDSLLLRIAVPLGISYYSFKILSYMIDVYKDPQKSVSWWNYLTYVSFFPQIICGPISRYDEINDYLDAKIGKPDIKEGLYTIIKGLFYKAVIADRLSEYTSTIFGSYSNYNYLALCMAVFFFSIELYCDFAGYSYIVIGICRLMGIRITDNFRNPYFAVSVKDFWSRWHISLTRWLKDYIYIPLGGNKKGKARRVINILIVFAISGLWHGDSPVYLLWGLWHGVWNALSFRKVNNRVLNILCTLYTYIIVSLGWIAFKIDNVKDIVSYIVRMFKVQKVTFDLLAETVMPFSNDYSSAAKMIVAIILIGILWGLEYTEFRKINENKAFRTVLYVSCIVLFGMIGSNSFIYANY